MLLWVPSACSRMLVTVDWDNKSGAVMRVGEMEGRQERLSDTQTLTGVDQIRGLLGSRTFTNGFTSSLR